MVNRLTDRLELSCQTVQFLDHFQSLLAAFSLQSHSFFQGYRTILPTSLTYIILLVRGFEPWRPAAEMSTAKGRLPKPSNRFSRYSSSSRQDLNGLVLS